MNSEDAFYKNKFLCWSYFYKTQIIKRHNIYFQEKIFFEDLIFNIKVFSISNISTYFSGVEIYGHVNTFGSSSRTKNLSRNIMRFRQSIVGSYLILKSKITTG